MKKSKLLKIYQDRKTGSLFIRATKVDEHGKFALKHHKYGKAVSGRVSDAKLGKTIREVLKNCE